MMFNAIRSFIARGSAVSSHIYPSRGVCNFSRRERLVVTKKRTAKCKFNPESSNVKLTDALTELTTAQKAQNTSNAKLTDALNELTISHKSWGQMLFISLVAQMLFVGAMEIPKRVELPQIPKKSPEEMRDAMEANFLRILAFEFEDSV